MVVGCCALRSPVAGGCHCGCVVVVDLDPIRWCHVLPLLLAVEREHNGVETLLSSLSLFLSVEVVCCDVEMMRCQIRGCITPWMVGEAKKLIRRCLMPGMVPEFILVLYILVNKSVLGNNNAQYWLYRWGRDGGYG